MIENDNTDLSFDDFYSIYPRKVGRKPAKMVWDRMSENDKILAMQNLSSHIAYWEALGTTKEFIPHARTWLYQDRWTDEIELPKPKTIEPAWWTTDAGIMAKGRDIGVFPRPGEDMYQYKGRLIDRINNKSLDNKESEA
jgi:hypothetical protein